MFIEFQIASDKLLTLVANRLKLQRLCFAGEFELNGIPCLIDAIRFGPGTLRMREDSSLGVAQSETRTTTLKAVGIQLIQEVSPVIKKVEEVVAAGIAPAPELLRPTLELVFDLRLEIVAGKPSLTYGFDRIKVLPLLLNMPGVPGMVARLEAALRAAPPVRNALDISGLRELLPAGAVLRSGGINADWKDAEGKDKQAETVAIRLEFAFATEARLQAWEAFARGSIPRRRGDQDWSLFLSEELLVTSVATLVRQGLASRAATFALMSDPVGIWWNRAGIVRVGEEAPQDGQLIINFSGEAIDACICGGEKQDVNVDVSVTVRFFVPEPGLLQMSIAVGWTVNDLEIICCALTAAFIGGTLGMGIGTAVGGPVGAAVGAGLGAVVGFAGVVGVATLYTPDFDIPRCTPVGDSGKNFLCEMPLPVPASSLGALTVEKAVGLDDGLALTGRWAVRALSDAELHIGELPPLEWRLGAVCGSGGIVASTFVTLENRGSAPLSICAIEIVDDPHRNYEFDPSSPLLIERIGPGGTLRLALSSAHFEAFASLPAAEQYPLRMWIRTRGGVRFLRLPAVEPLTDARREELKRLHRALQDACVTPINRLLDLVRLKPRWWEEPRVPGDIWHVWKFAVVGVRPGQTLLVTDGEGRRLATGHPTGGGLVQVDAMVRRPAEGEMEIALEVTGGRSRSPAGRSEPGARLMVRQVTLVPRARLSLNAPARQIILAPYDGRTALWAATAEGVSVYDLSEPSLPQQVLQEADGDLRGLVAWEEGVLAYGKKGVKEMRRRGAALLRNPSPLGQAHSVRDAAVANGRLVVLRDSAVQVFAPDSRLLSSIAVRDAHSVRPMPRGVAVSGKGGVTLYGWNQIGKLGRRAALRDSGQLRREVPDVINGRSSFLVGDAKGGARLYSWTGAHPAFITAYAAEPWYSRSVRSGRIMVTWDATGRTATIFEMRVHIPDPLQIH